VKFGTILADCPWKFDYWADSAVHRQGERHYETRDTDWIASLPVEGVAARDAVLLLWVLNHNWPDGVRVAEAWGFSFKTTLTWVKMARPAVPRIGIGHHIRSCTEHLLICTRGTARAPETARRPPSVLFHPRGEHSKKPEFQYDLAENYAGPYLELFHRPRDGGLFPPREGWTFAGNEVSGLDMREELRRLALADREGVAA
jgi:N6-adenosine-specific RNA methylase IME4